MIFLSSAIKYVISKFLLCRKDINFDLGSNKICRFADSVAGAAFSRFFFCPVAAPAKCPNSLREAFAAPAKAPNRLFEANAAANLSSNRLFGGNATANLSPNHFFVSYAGPDFPQKRPF
jgi:hypothetical protein